MEKVILKAEKREIKGRKVKNLRLKGIIPAVLYGKDFENIVLALDEKEFNKVYTKAGSSTIVDLEIGDDTHKILIHEPQMDAVTDKYIHVDLYKVNMKQEIHTEIPLEFVGVSPAVADLEGNLITNKDALEVKCLPDKLVSNIEVNISVLKTFDDIIKVGDLTIPEGIEIQADAEEIVAQVTPPRSEEELEEMESEAAADVEKENIESMEAEAEKEKAEKEEGAEGEEGEEKSAEKPNDDKNEKK